MKKPILISFLLILIVFLADCAAQVEKQPACIKPYTLVNNDCCLDRNENSVCDTNEKTEAENKTSDEEKPEEVKETTEKVNTESEEDKLMETLPYRFELNNNQLAKDTILTIKFDNDGKWKAGILYINDNKVEISQTSSAYSLYIS